MLTLEGQTKIFECKIDMGEYSVGSDKSYTVQGISAEAGIVVAYVHSSITTKSASFDAAIVPVSDALGD
jgi:hypothetical protein